MNDMKIDVSIVDGKKELKSHCNSCNSDTNHKVIIGVNEEGYSEEYCFSIEHYIIQCLGCENISYRKEISCSEDDPEWDPTVHIFPEKEKPTIDKNDKIMFLNHKLKHVYKETIDALNANFIILSAAGLRAIVESLFDYCYYKHYLLKNPISKNRISLRKLHNLKKKIDFLSNEKYISSNNQINLHQVRFLGNHAVHAIEDITYNEVILAFEIVNHILLDLFVNTGKGSELKFYNEQRKSK
jgi:hypothetical protein